MSISSVTPANYTDPTKQDTSDTKDKTETTTEQTTSDGNISIRYETDDSSTGSSGTEGSSTGSSGTGESSTSDDGVASEPAVDLTNALNNLAVGTALATALGAISNLKSGDEVKHGWDKTQSRDGEEEANAELQINGQDLDVSAQDNSQWWLEQRAASDFSVDALSSDGNQNFADLTRQPGVDALLETGNFKV